MADRQQLARARRGAPPGGRPVPGRRTEWIGGSPPIAAAVAFAVPEGASTFVSWWSSTISARGRCAAASAAKRIISTAPRAKFGAWNTGRPAARARSPTSLRSAPLVPTTHGTPAATARVDVCDHRVRAGEVDHRVGAAEPVDERVAGRLERRAEYRADLAARAVQNDAHSDFRPRRPAPDGPARPPRRTGRRSARCRRPTAGRARAERRPARPARTARRHRSRRSPGRARAAPCP